jgi:hypothetical protein
LLTPAKRLNLAAFGAQVPGCDEKFEAHENELSARDRSAFLLHDKTSGFVSGRAFTRAVKHQ